ncbi:MAG: ATP-binding protein [Chloroflexi bacterium]|nr:ATP-binding protein [Chloroflexota bacterium]
MSIKLRKAGANWVDGDKFFDREIEIRALAERIRDGHHTLLTAQRRMGKTSLVRELLRRLQIGGNYETVFVDLEACMDPADAIAEIAFQARSVESAWRRIVSGFANRLQGAWDQVDELGIAELRIKLRASVDKGTWQADGDRVFQALANCRKPVVLAIDELPILVNRMIKGQDFLITGERRKAADSFLSWLRRNGQDHRGRVHLVLAGSIGLEPVLRQAGLSAHANIYLPYELHPWEERTAANCIAALAAEYELLVPIEVRQWMCRKLRRCIPHHVQQYFDHLHEHLRRRCRSTATVSDAKSVYERDLLSVRGQIDLEHYQTRLRMAVGPESYRTALELMTEAAINDGQLDHEIVNLYREIEPSGSAIGKIELDDLLHLLQHDGYLEPCEGGLRFASGLLEDWWLARHGRYFKSITERRV